MSQRFKSDASKVTSMLQVLGSLPEEIQGNHRETPKANRTRFPGPAVCSFPVWPGHPPPWKRGPYPHREFFAGSLASAKAKPSPGSKGHAMFDPLVPTRLV